MVFSDIFKYAMELVPLQMGDQFDHKNATEPHSPVAIIKCFVLNPLRGENTEHVSLLGQAHTKLLKPSHMLGSSSGVNFHQHIRLFDFLGI